MSSEEQQETQVIGPGQILKSARLSASLSIKDIALKIHLKSIMIEDLEADKYDNNISLTFIKGYLKLYAKQVNVSEFEVMKAFESINTQKKEPAKLQSFSRRVAHQANDDKLMLVTYFILAVVFALVVVWWFQQGENDNTGSLPALPKTTQTQATLDDSLNKSLDAIVIADEITPSDSQEDIIPDDIDPQQTNQILESDTLNNTLDNLADIQTQEVSGQEVSTQDIVTQETSLEIPQKALTDIVQSQLAETVELVFEFSEDCWMNLSDATGEAIAYGVKASGRVMPVSGLPPFVVTLGAPQAVQITYAGEAVDMSVFKPGNTAKFTLPYVD
ncbi:MAG: cytoskeleton protein RodZ [Paraglaciecola sp.]|jgi:cytoskeleton protein RodZ